MFRRVNSSPVLFAQALETKNRQRFRRFKSIAEKVSNLLSDRSVLALRSSLKFPVERVGKVLDVQNCHGITPKLLHNGGTAGDVSRPLLSPRMSIGSSSLRFSFPSEAPITRVTLSRDALGCNGIRLTNREVDKRLAEWFFEGDPGKGKSEDSRVFTGGSDGTRTRDLLRDRQA